MSLIPMDPTQIDHHASYHSPLHPLRNLTPIETSGLHEVMQAANNCYDLSFPIQQSTFFSLEPLALTQVRSKPTLIVNFLGSEYPFT